MDKILVMEWIKSMLPYECTEQEKNFLNMLSTQLENGKFRVSDHLLGDMDLDEHEVSDWVYEYIQKFNNEDLPIYDPAAERLIEEFTISIEFGNFELVGGNIGECAACQQPNRDLYTEETEEGDELPGVCRYGCDDPRSQHQTTPDEMDY